MIKGVLLGLSLVVNTAVEPYQPQGEPDPLLKMTVQQKNALVQPLMRSATDCVVKSVSSDSKFQATMPPTEVNDLIVSSMGACVEQMRALIDAYDRLFGEGAGEAFFMGPYLEVLPKAVVRQVKGTPLP